jgi:hypothetical protein
MPSIINNPLRILNADALVTRLAKEPSYLFIGKNTPWQDEEMPDLILDSTEEKIELFDNILALKKIEPSNTSSVIHRINWISGDIYDSFDHRQNMVDGRDIDGRRFRFYVMTDEFNVYKCLSNNGGVPSTVRPTSQQLTPFYTPDGYCWKFMYTIRASDVFNFLTSEWMPVYTLQQNDGSSQWLVQENAIPGGIHDIKINSRGSGYDTVNVPTVQITGNGTGATAIVQVSPIDGGIDRILITNPGSGYTQASTTVQGLNITPAQVIPILSPINGHGKDSVLELGGTHKMIKTTLNGSEGGLFPITSFRQAGIISKPIASGQYGTRLIVGDTNGFSVGDTVNGTLSGATAIIRLIEIDSNIIWLSNVLGTFSQGDTLTNGTISTNIQTVFSNVNIPLVAPVVAASELQYGSGNILYQSNRVLINRANGQSEEVRMVITF